MTETLHYQPLGTSPTASPGNLAEHLKLVHRLISSRYPDIDRVAMATYDASTDGLSTFVSSNKDGVQLEHHAAKLSDVPSLEKLAQTRQSRTVHEMGSAFTAPSKHTQWLKAQAYQSSFTVPVFQGDQLSGFLFFDSKKPRVFDAETIGFLEVFANLVSQLYLLQLQVVYGILGTVRVASDLARIRDLETGQHLQRMAAYSRLMARELAQARNISDEFIEYLFQFAPLHDIGKIGIPDHVLLKPGKLNDEEWVIMRRHVDIGVAIVDQMSKNLGLGSSLAHSVMRNIVAHHHERGDGTGYPKQLRLADIPLEARIVAVADVYDALTNKRPYKEAWGEQAVRTELGLEVARGRLDGDCVRVLLDCAAQRAEIAQAHADTNARWHSVAGPHPS